MCHKYIPGPEYTRRRFDSPYEIACETKFPYLGSVIAPGRVNTDVSKCIVQASRAYGALQRLFDEQHFVCAHQSEHLPSMHAVHTTVWIGEQRELRKLDSFHPRCM